MENNQNVQRYFFCLQMASGYSWASDWFMTSQYAYKTFEEYVSVLSEETKDRIVAYTKIKEQDGKREEPLPF